MEKNVNHFLQKSKSFIEKIDSNCNLKAYQKTLKLAQYCCICEMKNILVNQNNNNNDNNNNGSDPAFDLQRIKVALFVRYITLQ